jgi:ribosomal protein S18 acetylase RimI-like enzyme
MSIRKAETSDARGIAEVHVAAWKSAYRGLLPNHVLDNLSVEDVEKRWQTRLTEAWGQFLVLEQGNRIAGFASCGSSRDEDDDPRQVGEVYVIYVAPAEWRKGYGTALLREAIKLLRGQGFSQVILWVLHNNQQAKKFYEAAGFVADGTSQVKTRADGTEMQIVRYRRPL